MTVTPKPTITVRVSGPVGSGKSYVLTRIKEMVKKEFGKSVIVDAAVVDDERICRTNELLQEQLMKVLRKLTGQTTKCFQPGVRDTGTHPGEHAPLTSLPGSSTNTF